MSDDSSYPEKGFRTHDGDFLLLYSDAFIEAVDSNGEFLGVNGLVQTLNEIRNPQPATAIPALCSRLKEMSSDNLNDDDATLILGSFTRGSVPLAKVLLTPFRLLGKVSDKSNVKS